ncbi:MAG: hypothetical protein WED07_11655 [Candidatus Freyarchaeum deiterrae]
MSLEKRKKNDSRRFTAGNVGKWMVVGSELPIMVIAGVYIGYYLGQQFGSWVATFAPIIGALLGMLVGTYNIIRIVRLWESRQISKRIDKKEPPAPSSPSEESKDFPAEAQKKRKGSKLSQDEKLDSVIKLMKLQANFEDDEGSSSTKNDKKRNE